jgi:hypothetical protein
MAEVGDDPLLDSGAFASILDDLNVRKRACFLDSDEHGANSYTTFSIYR